MRWAGERRAVARWARDLLRQGLLAGTSGNISLRRGDVVLVSPTGRPWATLRPEEVVAVGLDGEPVEGDLPPSSELLLHLAVYRARRDVGAVIHTHSLYASVCAVAGLEVPPLVDEMVIKVGGAVRLADYAPPGTEDLARRAVEALGERNAVLLRHHGMVGVGKHLGSAAEVCQVVERCAQVFVLASLLGRAHPLPEEVVRVEEELFRMRQRADLSEPPAGGA